MVKEKQVQAETPPHAVNVQIGLTATHLVQLRLDFTHERDRLSAVKRVSQHYAALAGGAITAPCRDLVACVWLVNFL